MSALSAAKVLLIDDDPELLAMLKFGLEHEGFDVVTARGGRQGLHQAYHAHPDVVILDVMMHGMDGWATCQRLRQVSDVPIIMLTAMSGREHVIRGLSLGADDYVIKPCSFEELKARILSRLRRKKENSRSDGDRVFDGGELRINLNTGLISRQGRQVTLSPTELRLLRYLIHHQGRIVPHRELLAHVWGPGYVHESGNLGVYIGYLRKKIERNPARPRHILTRYRLGYLFAGREA